MAHSKQALKRARQGERNRLGNKARLSRLKTLVKAFMALVATGDKAKVAAKLASVCKTIDKAAQTHVIHANQAARRKSQVARAVGAMK